MHSKSNQTIQWNIWEKKKVTETSEVNISKNKQKAI